MRRRDDPAFQVMQLAGATTQVLPARPLPVPFTFFLGTPEVTWFERTAVPLFVSHMRLRHRASVPRALGSWCLDSGAYTQVTRHGGFLDTPAQYAALVRRYRDEIGGMIWAAVQDWMVEQEALQATGLHFREHMRRSVHSYFDLRSVAPDLPWLPTLQPPYFEAIELFDKMGVDLRNEPMVGVGSVCRLQKTWDFPANMWELHYAAGLNLHGFGVKTEGLVGAKPFFVSTDSMAWSMRALKGGAKATGCSCTHARCTNCLAWALEWREQFLRTIDEERQI